MNEERQSVINWIEVLIDVIEDQYDEHEDWPEHKDDPGFFLNGAKAFLARFKAASE